MQRYLRHDLIDWFDQKRLKETKALVVGAGAVGNEVIKNLALLGIGAITVVDFDKIEAHNLTRSVLFGEVDIGRFKAEVAAESAKKLDPNCCVDFIVGDVWEGVDFSTFRRADVVFSCVDGFIARIRINQLCMLLGLDLINAGIDSRFVAAEIYPFFRDPDAGCYECNLPPSVYQRIAERYSCGWLKKVAFEEKKVPTTTITASFAGSLATSLFLYSFREDSPVGARRVFFDTVSYTSTTTNLPKNSTCPGCSDHLPEQVVGRADRLIDNLLFTNSRLMDQTITLSDPILVSWETPNCTQCCAAKEVVFRLASDFTDADAECARCGLKQKLANIRDQFTFRELAEFKGKLLPGKFAMVREGGTQIVIELSNGERHE